ncbi:histidine phosphatase superfamily (branch 1) domain-containing protein [Ditylenchus destructor]|uniref:Histidine phosphatase superfamily (Branch 1) domain-containing protein n=1 Tax=Ditylenchus destructor TaxID=166010 RepID=A0AAD4N8J4_9BILA|nr:histidine phosphatase superfamily (branch 1) domain-containing protein [Ditylenchus destructor]
MGRTLWVIRHAEREDNINRSWQKAKNPRGLKSDNSPLSERGRKQADELAKRFADIDFDHVFASPFDRTVETATRTINNRQIPIKVEPGIAEAFYLCESPPGFEDAATLKKVYPLVDETYEPVFSHPLPKEGYGDEACIPRVKKTLETIFKKYNGGMLNEMLHLVYLFKII